MPKTVKDAIKLKSNAEYLRELRDMTKCPECGKVQSVPRTACEGMRELAELTPMLYMSINWS